jgi:F-type H+-transporting ATPase subunit delta
VLETADHEAALRLAADLAAVDHLFAGNEALRAALSDTSVVGPARRAVLDELLEGKVSDGARRAAAFAAGAVPAAEVPGAMTWLAHRARRAAEDRDEPLPALGHLAARQRVGGFAAALYEDLPADRLEEVEDELFRFARTVETTPALREALGDRDLPVAVRRGVVDDLLSGKVQPATLRLVDFVVAGGRPRDVVGTLYWLVEATAQARGWRVAVVDAALDVDDAGRRALAESMGRLAGAPVELQVRIDPALLAGVRVRIGDLQVDATARDRIDRLREHVVTGGWEDRGFGPTQGGTG